MSAALNGSVTVGVCWGLPPGAAVLPPTASSTAARTGGTARLFTAWVPNVEGWSVASARVTFCRGDGLAVSVPMASATDVAAAAPMGESLHAAIPFYETTGRSVAVLAVKVRPLGSSSLLLHAHTDSLPSCLNLSAGLPPRT